MRMMRAVRLADTQEGTSVSGHLWHSWSSSLPWCDASTTKVTGTVNADGQVRLQVPNFSAALSGTMTLLDVTEGSQRLQLTYHGGIVDGQKVTVTWRKGD